MLPSSCGLQVPVASVFIEASVCLHAHLLFKYHHSCCQTSSLGEISRAIHSENLRIFMFGKIPGSLNVM